MPFIYEVFVHFLRERALLLWLTSSITIIILSIFLAGTLLGEHAQAAIAFACIGLRFNLLSGLLVWGSIFFSRTFQTDEHYFWLTLPVSRARIFISFIIMSVLVALFMLALQGMFLAIFLQLPRVVFLEFIHVSALESLLCVVTLTIFSLTSKGNLKAAMATFFILILAYMMPYLHASIKSLPPGFSLWKAFIVETVSLLTRAGPKLNYGPCFQDWLQNTGFVLMLGVLCYNDFAKKNF